MEKVGRLKFKIDVMAELKKKDLTPKTIRDKRLLSQSVLTDIRRGKVPVSSIPALCELLGRQPGSMIKYVPYDSIDIPENENNSCK